VDLRLRLLSGQEPVLWKVVAKDGADLPPTQIATSPADMVLTVGATSDVEVTLEKSGIFWLQASSENLAAGTMYPLLALTK